MGRTRKTGGSGQRQTLPQRGAGAGPSAGARDGRDEHRHGDDHEGKPLVCFQVDWRPLPVGLPFLLRLYQNLFNLFVFIALFSLLYVLFFVLNVLPFASSRSLVVLVPSFHFFAPKNFTAESEKARQNGTPKTALQPPKTPPSPPLLLGPSPFLSFWYVHLLLLGCLSSISFSVYLRVSGAAKAAKLQPKHHKGETDAGKDSRKM